MTWLSRIVAPPVIYAGLAAGALITLAPFALGLMTSFTSAEQFNTEAPLSLPSPPTLANYTGLAEAGFGRALVVTALMTAVILVGQLTFSVLAAYRVRATGVPRPRRVVLGVRRHADGARDGDGGAAVPDDGRGRSAQHVLGVGAAVHVRLAVRDLPAARVLPCDPRPI